MGNDAKAQIANYIMDELEQDSNKSKRELRKEEISDAIVRGLIHYIYGIQDSMSVEANQEVEIEVTEDILGYLRDYADHVAQHILDRGDIRNASKVKEERAREQDNKTSQIEIDTEQEQTSIDGNHVMKIDRASWTDNEFIRNPDCKSNACKICGKEGFRLFNGVCLICLAHESRNNIMKEESGTFYLDLDECTDDSDGGIIGTEYLYNSIGDNLLEIIRKGRITR